MPAVTWRRSWPGSGQVHERPLRRHPRRRRLPRRALATMAIRAHLRLDVVDDVIQPFPSFSEAFLPALLQLRAKVPAAA
jgi:hypothetical protein